VNEEKVEETAEEFKLQLRQWNPNVAFKYDYQNESVDNRAKVISDGFVVASDRSILILTRSGELVERLSGSEGIPAGIKSTGLSGSEDIVIKAEHGDYIADGFYGAIIFVACHERCLDVV